MIKKQVTVKTLELATFLNIHVREKIKFINFHSSDANYYGAELITHPRHVSSHISDTQKMTLDLGAKAIGAETCKLDAN